MNARKLLVGLALVVAAAASWWFTREAAPPPDAVDAKKRHDPDYIVEGFDGTTMNEKGLPRYHLTARRLTHYPDDDTAHFVEPVLVQFLPNGSRMTTRANAGVMPGTGREIVMTGNVRATRTGDPRAIGGELRAERLRIELDR